MKNRDVIVIGGGAAGMMAAITAAKTGAKVTILERKEALGKKLLATGNGRCNFTNGCMALDCYASDSDPDTFIANVLGNFGTTETLRFFNQMGVLLKERKGYYYPETDQAITIVEVLKTELIHLGVEVMTNAEVISIEKSEQEFIVSHNKITSTSKRVILTTGGKAAPNLGSDGSGYEFAKSLGHTLIPVVPALVALKGKGKFYKKLSGVRTNAKVTAFVDGQKVASDIGELQLTSYGISGIPVFQVSRYIAKAFHAHKEADIQLDFMSERSEIDFLRFLLERREQLGYKSAYEYMVGIFKDKLCSFFLYTARIDEKKYAHSITDEELQKLVRICKFFRIQLEGTNSFDEAQVCAGGVSLKEVDRDTMESKIVPGLYLAGEILDVDGICGGYNLQWAWATGNIAGSSAGIAAETTKNAVEME